MAFEGSANKLGVSTVARIRFKHPDVTICPRFALMVMRTVCGASF